MRHTVHIMLGMVAGPTLCNIKQYIQKYATDHEADYFNAILYDYDASQFLRAEISKEDTSVFHSGLDGIKAMLSPWDKIPPDNRVAFMKNFFANLYKKTININNQGDSQSLHLCVYLPLYDQQAWSMVCEILSAVEGVQQQFQVDLFMLYADMAYLFDDHPESLPERMEEFCQQSRSTINSALQAKKEYKSLSHLILMQNCNSNGLSLNLDSDSFVRIVGEYALLSISHYGDMFNPAAQDPNRPIHSLGLSVLSFDRYYFVQYLLHKTYIHVLDREKVNQQEVDVNKVSQIVQGILAGNVTLFSNIYSKYVQPRLDRGDDHTNIIVELHPILENEIERLATECQSFIDDASLSLPDKKATLAQLLGEDDELLVGNLFNRQQPVIDDVGREVLDFFVADNNRLAELYSPLAEKMDDTQRKLNEIAGYAALSGTDHESVQMPSQMLDHIKDLKISMRESTDYIRRKSKELDDLDVQIHENIESQKRLTSNGFVFEGHTFRLQKNDIEIPCDDEYKPKSTSLKKVDLREYFTKVKNQGSLGACSAFTLVGIYEYILKKNHCTEADLSEYFVYYNVRKRNGKEGEDSGSSLRDVVLTMGNEGVCSEKLCPYSETDQYVPSDEAYADAKNHRVAKALNVKKNIDDIKSAIAEGYPVAVSLRIFDSFTPQNGFVVRPSEEEIASNEYGNHAMIACGYSDDERVFIVRNSWGENFGVKGYCYIPYSYFEDFLDVACIIAEVCNSDIKVAGNDTKTTFSFDLTDSHINASLLRILIDEEKHRLAINGRHLYDAEQAYNILFQSLGNNAVRNRIVEGTKERLRYERDLIQKEKQSLEKNRDEELSGFDRLTRWAQAGFYLFIILVVATYALLWLKSGIPSEELFFNTLSYIVYGITAIVVTFFILWARKRHHDRIGLDEDMKSKIEKCAREIRRLDDTLCVNKLKSHVAGMILDSLASLFHKLHSKYNGMRSFLGNLRTWREEEDSDSQMSDSVSEPFLSLISNTCLDQYFDICKDDITSSIKLCEMFRNSYFIDEKQIVAFKNQMKQTIVDALFHKIDDFSVYSCIVGDEKYDYVDNRYVDVNELLQNMDAKSEHFVETQIIAFSPVAINSCCKLLFLATTDNNAYRRWQNICTPNFKFAPVLVRSASPFKLTLLQIDGLSIDEITLLKQVSLED